MGSKAMLVLVLLLASVLLLSAEVAPKDVDGKFHKNDDNSLDTNGVDDMKYDRSWQPGYVGWQPGYGGWRRGWQRGWYCPYGCCRWSYYGNFCRSCCYYPGQHVDAHADAEPRN